MEFWRSCWNPQMKHTNGESSKSRWKNGVSCLVIMVTLRVTVIKMSKITSADRIKPVTVWAKYLSASERSHLALSFSGLLGIKLS